MQTTLSLPWDRLRDMPVHMVGIKGNGMASLAASLHARGARISGSDTGESFFTDVLLQKLGIEVAAGFDAAHVASDARVLVYSPAFDPASNPEILEARRRGLPALSYPEALGQISAQFDSCGVAGSHGKTTTTALCAVLCKALGLEATAIVPSILPDLGDMPIHDGGRRFLVAETCEYRRHFLCFRPRRIVLTTVEAEHLDYYRDFRDVCDAFVEYAALLPAGGTLIYNADDAGCREIAGRVDAARIGLLPYGRGAEGDYRIVELAPLPGTVRFRLAGEEIPFELHVPGLHNAYNAAAAVALICSLAGEPLSRQPRESVARLRGALAGFRGSKRRVEVIGNAGGVLVLDDYGHHPTEIATTLAGLKSFYAGRRLVVDFMPHTYSRTRALFGDFLRAFGAADEVVLHRIYASARERDDGSVNGRMLADSLAKHHPAVRYFEEPLASVDYLAASLREGDVLVTMGAGDNWRVGRAVLEALVAGAGRKGGAA
jgi:UDP-N-acetylmuramate--alanine ligase